MCPLTGCNFLATQNPEDPISRHRFLTGAAPSLTAVAANNRKTLTDVVVFESTALVAGNDVTNDNPKFATCVISTV